MLYYILCTLEARPRVFGIWVGLWDPFSLLPVLALKVAVIFLSSGQSGLTKSQILQILFAGDLWPTQSCLYSRAENPPPLPVTALLLNRL